MTTILIIEDEPELLENIAELLEAELFEVVSAGDGRAGLEMIKAKRPDLILCDIRMPGLDGYGVLKALQQNSATASIPLIFLSATADKDNILKGLDSGAAGYLTKPFKLSALVALVHETLGS